MRSVKFVCGGCGLGIQLGLGKRIKMSIEHIGDKEYSLICDDCHESRTFSSFKKAVAFKKEQKKIQGGWRTYRKNDEFYDSCPDCVAAFIERGY